jgi:hypothetical protein
MNLSTILNGACKQNFTYANKDPNHSSNKGKVTPTQQVSQVARPASEVKVSYTTPPSTPNKLNLLG